jgi:hypothetical protein
MFIDSNLIPIFAIGVGLIIAVTTILSSTISKTKLTIEQIRADALVKAEEVRAKNQLELEKLMRQEEKLADGVDSTDEPVQYNSHIPVQYGGERLAQQSVQEAEQYTEDQSRRSNRIRE